MPTPTKGGTRPGAGRKPADDPMTASLNLRMTKAQRDKLKELGGGAWVRKQIDNQPTKPKNTK